MICRLLTRDSIPMIVVPGLSAPYTRLSDLVGDGVLWLCRGVCVIVCVFISEFPAVVEICPDDSDQSDEPFLTVACLLGRYTHSVAKRP